MSEKLMYIYGLWADTQEADESNKQRHVGIARAAGYDVQLVCNNGVMSGNALGELLKDVQTSDGIWLDVPVAKIGDRSRRLILAAGELGKRVMGVIKPDEEEVIRESLQTYFPTKQEAVRQ